MRILQTLYMSMKLIKQLLAVFILLLSLKGVAQDERFSNPLVTDRPDATEASSTVGKGVFQIETGGFYESFEENVFGFNTKLESYTLNTMLLRYGILDNMEFRLGITEEKGALPEIALLLHVNHQFFAGKDYATASTGTDFRFSLAHTLSEKSSLGYNLGMSWNGNTTRENFLYTIAYGYSISDKMGAYADIIGMLDSPI